MKTIYQVVTGEGASTEKRVDFNTYTGALTEAEKIENEQVVHIHQIDDGEVVGCLWDNAVMPPEDDIA